MAFTDFPNGIGDSSDYLNPSNQSDASLTGSPIDIDRVIVSGQLENKLKEIICSLLAGRGLKLPNVQICISLNLKELLKIPNLQDELSEALGNLDDTLDDYLDHLKLDAVLGRISGVLGELSNIANMINFCSAPIDPIQIPSVLETAMGSFLGSGLDLLNRIGSVPSAQIGGCLIDGSFNCAAFDGGILKSICDNIDDVNNGTVDTDTINAIVAEINDVISDINTIIDNETSVSGSYSQGGSDLAETPRVVNEGLGVLFNATDEGIQGATRYGGQLWAAYQQLGSYQVVDSDGNVYNNIFELFVDDDLMRVLRRTSNPTPEISEQVPVYNYCGEVVGYTKTTTQAEEDTSVGLVPGTIDQPGFNAGGIQTNPITEAQDQTGGGTVVNEITNITNVEGSTTLFADSEFAQLNLTTTKGQLVFRTDTSLLYVDNGGTSGTMADYTTVTKTLGTFLNTVNTVTGIGILSRNNDAAEYRTITGTSNQITVTNGSGASGNPTISITSNPNIPGTDAMQIPTGTTGERASTTNGSIRYNSTLNRFEGYQSGAWAGFATGAGSVTDGSNVGLGAYQVYKQNNSGVLEFRTIAVSNGITASVATDVITLGDSITASNVGSGTGTFKTRNTNDFEFKSIVAGDNISVADSADEVTITADIDQFKNSIQTTNATATEILFDGGRQTPASNKTWFVTVTAVANRSSSSDATAIKIEGIVDNNAGTVSIVGTVGNKTVYNSTAGTANYDLLLDVVTGTEFRVRVQGDTGHNVDWTVKLDYTEA